MTKCTWIGKGERCQHHTLPGRNYCEQHIWTVYQKGTQLGKRKKDIRVATSVFFWEGLMNEAVEELEAEGFDFTIKEWDVEDLIQSPIA